MDQTPTNPSGDGTHRENNDNVFTSHNNGWNEASSNSNTNNHATTNNMTQMNGDYGNSSSMSIPNPLAPPTNGSKMDIDNNEALLTSEPSSKPSTQEPSPFPSHKAYQTSVKIFIPNLRELWEGKQNNKSTTATGNAEEDAMEVDEAHPETFTHSLFGGAKPKEPSIAESVTNSTAQAADNEPLNQSPPKPMESPQKEKEDGDDELPNKDESQQDDDDEDDVQVLTKKQAEKEWRRKRKRQLQKQLETPSFVAILEGPIEIDEDEQEQEQVKQEHEDVKITKIVINVDEYLQLGDSKSILPPSAVMSRSSLPPSASGMPIPAPSSILSASPVISTSSSQLPIDPDPKEEGYYEGVKLMAMPEDSIYLSDMQQWIRLNLEFFSATAMDSQMSQSGRRQRTVRGKVGVRCVHCARVCLPKFESKLHTTAIKYEQWPPGSVSYPATMDGLYSSCSQRPQLHFKTCPHISAAMRIQGAQWLGDTEDASVASGRKRKRCREGISALMYYHIACERIGLVETPGGLRFTRDLNLEPLPLEQAKHKIEETKPDLLVKPRQRQTSMAPMAATSSSTLPSGVKMEKQPCSNEECQQVLDEALQEEDDLSVRLACKVDHEMVSDYTFLAIKQMALCHASPLDFVSRGKKTKMMRLGFAGFCCRHCDEKGNVTHACRSYSSAPDNLASAISNSFVLHLAKCPHTPDKVKAALSVLKKIHSRQMQQLPYGSQRKCFMDLWRRMRAADKIVEGQENPTAEQIAEASQEAGISMSSALPDSVRSTSVETTIESNRQNARSEGFPVSSNENTLAVLKQAEEDWDPTKDNDGLMDKDDRFLVSDYVFLTMRQLDLALPTMADFRGNRRTNPQRMAGMQCRHCADDKGFVSSGRSFPSAPDNMASAFNTSLYNHMQACPGIPVELKGALYDLRKIHSMQCQNLVFGSQRKFFNKVFDKLLQVPIPESVLQALPPIQSPVKKVAPSYAVSYGAVSTISDETLQKHSFSMGPALDGFPEFYECQRCRAVPFVFRATGCLHHSRPSSEVVVKHVAKCQGDGICLGYVKKEFDGLTEDFEYLSELQPFRDLVRHVVGNDDELTELFCNPEVSGEKDTSGWWRRLPTTVDFDRAQKLFEAVASDLKLPSKLLKDQPKLLGYLQTISPSFQLPHDSSENEAGDGEDMNEGTELDGDKDETNHPEASADVTMKESFTTSSNEVDSTAAASPAPSKSIPAASTQPAGIPADNAEPHSVDSETHTKSAVPAPSGEPRKVDESSDDEGIYV